MTVHGNVQQHMSHDGLYAANELAAFTSPLPTEVELKDYEVGLQSIVYPPWLR